MSTNACVIYYSQKRCVHFRVTKRLSILWNNSWYLGNGAKQSTAYSSVLTRLIWGNGERQHSVPHTHSEWTTGADGYVPVPFVPDYRRWGVYDGIRYQVKQEAGNRGITAENMEKSQHTNFNKDKTNESASVACSNTQLWKLDHQKGWRNTSWRLWDEWLRKITCLTWRQLSWFLTKLEWRGYC